MDRTERDMRISIALNAAIVLTEAWALYRSLSMGGPLMLTFFTEDANILALISSAVYVILGLTRMRRGITVPSRLMVALRASANFCLTLTFLVVVFILAPVFGPRGYVIMMLRGSVLFLHNICPLLSMISFIFFEHTGMGRRDYVLPVIPMYVYAAAAITMNILRKWKGPYFFLMVYDQPLYMSVLWFILIIGGSLALSKALILLNRRYTS